MGKMYNLAGVPRAAGVSTASYLQLRWKVEIGCWAVSVVSVDYQPGYRYLPPLALTLWQMNYLKDSRWPSHPKIDQQSSPLKQTRHSTS
jgi:hypothetical protein